MSQSLFKCVEHVMPCQHIRHHKRATTSVHGEEPLYLAIKQYIPLDNPAPRPGDVTIIGSHCTGYQKELYEPIWDELYNYTKRSGTFNIRSIWMADSSFQGESGVMNEGKLGNQQSWMDHTRDLLLLVNTFRDRMIAPLVAFGHSMGGNNLLDLALIHPRLFTTLVLIEPVLQREPSLRGSNFYAAVTGLTFKKDLWPSREAAAESFRRNRFYKTWDPRVLDQFIKYGLRELPTGLYTQYQDKNSSKSNSKSVDQKPQPEQPAPPKPVTLRTTTHAEVFGYSKLKRNAPHPSTITEADLEAAHAKQSGLQFKDDALKNPFFRPEAYFSFWQLPVLAPSVLYINGEQSALGTSEKILERRNITGTDPEYGNGGVAAGAVKDVNLPGGHHVPFEKPAAVAEAGGDWIGLQVGRWLEAEAEEDKGKAPSVNEDGDLKDECVVDETWLFWAKDITRKSDSPKQTAAAVTTTTTTTTTTGATGTPPQGRTGGSAAASAATGPKQSKL